MERKKYQNSKKICPHCGNTSQQYVMGQLSGLNLGFVFMPAKTRIGHRNYYLVCAVCNKASKNFQELSLTIWKIVILKRINKNLWKKKTNLWKKKSNGMCIASFVLGLISIFLNIIKVIPI